MSIHSKNRDKPPSKRNYRSPKLSVYGHIREITKNVGVTGKNEGGGKLKTSL